MQAVLITAYKDYRQLYSLAESLHEKYAVYIHIDKKNIRNFDMKELAGLSDVHVCSRYVITWGSINHLYALIYLMKKALADERVKYIHFISAQDIAVRPLDQFDSDGHIYMSVADTPAERWQQYNLFQCANHGSAVIERLYRGSVKIQKAIHIRRRKIGNFRSVYKGMVWCSMPRAAAEYADEYIRVYPKYLKDLYRCYLPEEIFFQTLFLNSAEWKDKIITDNLRYTDWSIRNGSIPAILDDSDTDRIISSGAYFARKIDPVISEGLIEKLKCRQND